MKIASDILRRGACKGEQRGEASRKGRTRREERDPGRRGGGRGKEGKRAGGEGEEERGPAQGRVGRDEAGGGRRPRRWGFGRSFVFSSPNGGVGTSEMGGEMSALTLRPAGILIHETRKTSRIPSGKRSITVCSTLEKEIRVHGQGPTAARVRGPIFPCRTRIEKFIGQFARARRQGENRAKQFEIRTTSECWGHRRPRTQQTGRDALRKAPILGRGRSTFENKVVKGFWRASLKTLQKALTEGQTAKCVFRHYIAKEAGHVPALQPTRGDHRAASTASPGSRRCQVVASSDPRQKNGYYRAQRLGVGKGQK